MWLLQLTLAGMLRELISTVTVREWLFYWQSFLSSQFLARHHQKVFKTLLGTAGVKLFI